MRLTSGMLLYHGSYAPINEIDLEKCVAGKDFGRGFYLTEDEMQARNFIKNSLRKAKTVGRISEEQTYGYVTVFRYREPAEMIPSYVFDSAGKEWLWFVSLNRRSELAGKFRKILDKDLLNAEIVVGKIANDTTNPTIMAYLDGLYGDVMQETAVNFAVGQLRTDRLKNQVCFLSKRAVSCLELVEVKRYG